MNKNLIATLAIILGVAAIGFGIFTLISGKETNMNEIANNLEKESGMEESASKKSLIVVFSRAGENYNVGNITVGNTERMAKIISEETGAEIFKIEPTTPYPDNYDEATEVAKKEQANNARPEYVGDIKDWSGYNTVYLGYPIWWGDMPQIVYTFIEKHDWNGKTVIPFNTHEGSGSAGTYETLKATLSGATVEKGLAITGSKVDSSTEEIKNFAKGE